MIEVRLVFNHQILVLINVLNHCTCLQVIAYVKDEGANLATLATTLLSVVPALCWDF